MTAAGAAQQPDHERSQQIVPGSASNQTEGFAVTAIPLIAGERRYIRQSVLPMLAHTLRPLKPTERELAAALDRLSRAGLKVGRGIKLEQIFSALDEIEDW